MKRIFCIVIVILVSITIFCGCATKADGEVEKYGSYVILETTDKVRNNYIVYHEDTHIVYTANRLYSHSQTITPYQIYKDDLIYGAVYEDGEIKPVPYAVGLTDEMIKEYLNNFYGDLSLYLSKRIEAEVVANKK